VSSQVESRLQAKYNLRLVSAKTTVPVYASDSNLCREQEVKSDRRKKAYDFESIERKWRERWDEMHLFRADDEAPGRKFYVLTMFPYTSGALHIGNASAYVKGDCLVRYHLMRGDNVLSPMGWDTFGLPAENAAILEGIHPRDYTIASIKRMRKQFDRAGWGYDWDREVTTCEPEYYKWTQWIFLKMFENGLAYRAEMPINWCPSCMTGLANEEVVGGVCDRCGAQVTKKRLTQWMLRITTYAQRLLDDLDKLDWSDRVKKMQANWIGRSVGVEVDFPLAESDRAIRVFTTRPDTLYGATFMVLAPEHELVEEITTPERRDEVARYVEGALNRLAVERLAQAGEKTGVFTGAYCINPVNNERIPVWISDYVLAEYGTGAIMSVPGHDQRDFEFAKRFDLPIVRVIAETAQQADEPLEEAYTGPGVMVNSAEFSGMETGTGTEAIVDRLEKEGKGKRAISYRLRDWVFSRQRYWGEPIPIILCDRCGEVAVPEEELPVTLPEVKEYKPTGTGESPLADVPDWVNVKCPTCGGPAKRETNTMPQWAGSSWYFLRYADPANDKRAWDKDKASAWLPVDLYVGGIEHAILHLLYARFYTKFLYDIGEIDFDEPFTRLFNQGMIYKDGAKMSKSKGNLVVPDEVIGPYGSDTFRLYVLFMGPPEKDLEWSDRGVVGAHRFLQRLWETVHDFAPVIADAAPTELLPAEVPAPYDDILRKTHQVIAKVTDDMEGDFHFNTDIAAIMELVNMIRQVEPGALSNETVTSVMRKAVESVLQVVAPMTPHIAEELWQTLGHAESIFRTPWPGYSPEAAKAETVEIPVQVNGKLRARITVDADADESVLRETALADDRIKKHTDAKTIRKVIVVPGKLVNVVVG